MYHLDAQFLTHVFLCCNIFLFILEAVGLPVSTRNLRMYPMFNVEASSKSYPSGRCAAITNVA
jgi:hypothetical protein